MTQQRQGVTGSQALGKQAAGRFIESQIHHDPMATRVKHQIILGFIHPIQRNGVREIRHDSVKIGGDSPAVTEHPSSNAETRLLCCGRDTTRGRNINAPARFAENAVWRGQLLRPIAGRVASVVGQLPYLRGGHNEKHRSHTTKV